MLRKVLRGRPSALGDLCERGKVRRLQRWVLVGTSCHRPTVMGDQFGHHLGGGEPFVFPFGQPLGPEGGGVEGRRAGSGTRSETGGVLLVAPPQVPEHSIRVGHGHVGDLPLGLVRESFFLTGQDTEDIIGDPGVLVSVSHVRRVCFHVRDLVTTPVDPPPRAWGLRWRER